MPARTRYISVRTDDMQSAGYPYAVVGRVVVTARTSRPRILDRVSVSFDVARNTGGSGWTPVWHDEAAAGEWGGARDTQLVCTLNVHRAGELVRRLPVHVRAAAILAVGGSP